MRFGLLGEHLSHSFSPQIHAYWGNDPYDLFEVAPSDVEDFLKNGDFDGINVTIPYKKTVARCCAELSAAARAIGSVNTILRRPDGSLYGDNTDVDGFSWLLERNGGIEVGEKALILGSGGASLTVQAVLKGLGAECVIISRKGENNYVNYFEHSDAVLLVNASPVGMYPNNGSSLVDLALLPKLRCVLDLVYNPLNTKLLLDAADRGIRCENGLSMLVGQAHRAREIWYGEKMDAPSREEVLCKLNKKMRNIVLVGMPGCGKSTVGKLLAERLGRPFFDSDAELTKKIGPVPDFIKKHGEEAFRKHETEILAELGKKSACVIATGGGCVTRAENEAFLRQNGLIIALHRSLELLPKKGRPLSLDLEKLWAQRAPLYARFSDLTVENDRLETTVNTILEAVE